MAVVTDSSSSSSAGDGDGDSCCGSCGSSGGGRSALRINVISHGISPQVHICSFSQSFSNPNKMGDTKRLCTRIYNNGTHKFEWHKTMYGNLRMKMELIQTFNVYAVRKINFIIFITPCIWYTLERMQVYNVWPHKRKNEHTHTFIHIHTHIHGKKRDTLRCTYSATAQHDYSE